MRILIIGFFAFAIWSALSTYIYVCKIKGLCYEPMAMQTAAVKLQVVKPADSKREQTVIPKDLIIYFAFDKSDLVLNEILDKYFVLSKEYLDQNALAKLSVTGHTDAIGSDEYNLALGYRRAQSLQYYFVRKGILASRIIVDSKGEKKPLSDNNTKSGRANNRRSEITIKK
jgi:outer membrane protein OmpA-like peptidoglycan-associated protein